MKSVEKSFFIKKNKRKNLSEVPKYIKIFYKINKIINKIFSHLNLIKTDIRNRKLC